ncbi:hypothetical protein STEG23_035940 [Scotinomys teguina]
MDASTLQRNLGDYTGGTRQQEEKTPVWEEEKKPAYDGRGHHVVEQGSLCMSLHERNHGKLHTKPVLSGHKLNCKDLELELHIHTFKTRELQKLAHVTSLMDPDLGFEEIATYYRDKSICNLATVDKAEVEVVSHEMADSVLFGFHFLTEKNVPRPHRFVIRGNRKRQILKCQT